MIYLLLFPLRRQQDRTDTIFQKFLFIQQAVHLKELGYQTCPAGLVAGPYSGPIIAVKKFMEQNVITPVWIRLKFVRASVDMTLAFGIPREHTREAL